MSASGVGGLSIFVNGEQGEVSAEYAGLGTGVTLRATGGPPGKANILYIQPGGGDRPIGLATPAFGADGTFITTVYIGAPGVYGFSLSLGDATSTSNYITLTITDPSETVAGIVENGTWGDPLVIFAAQSGGYCRYVPTVGAPAGAALMVWSSQTAREYGAYEWAWDFGDGTKGVGDNPFHIYKAKGTYTATVTATKKADGTTSGASLTFTTPPVGTPPPP